MRTALAFLLTITAAAGADLSGIWVGQIPRPNNLDPIEVAFQFTQKGAALSGKLYGDYKSTLFSDGAVEGDSVNFVVVTQEQAGNQINETRLQFTGVLKDGELELTRERLQSKTVGNGGDAPNRPTNPTKQVFRLKRLL